MNQDQLEARLARIDARLDILETIEARAVADTDPPPHEPSPTGPVSVVEPGLPRPDEGAC